MGSPRCHACGSDDRDVPGIVDGYEGYYRCDDSWHTPTPPADDDDVARARERVIEAARTVHTQRMVRAAGGSVAVTMNYGPLHEAIVAMEAAERAAKGEPGEKGGV